MVKLLLRVLPIMLYAHDTKIMKAATKGRGDGYVSASSSRRSRTRENLLETLQYPIKGTRILFFKSLDVLPFRPSPRYGCATWRPSPPVYAPLQRNRSLVIPYVANNKEAASDPFISQTTSRGILWIPPAATATALPLGRQRTAPSFWRLDPATLHPGRGKTARPASALS